MFNSMDPGKQKGVAEELDRTPSEVSYHSWLYIVCINV